jgi:hypothetical protein
VTGRDVDESAEKGAVPVGVVLFPVEGAYRVGRRAEPLSYSRISPFDAQTTMGNRYDVAGGGVLYCATNIEGCYAETLARFRPSPVVIAALDGNEMGRMNRGSVAADWRLRREWVRAQCDHALPFLNVEDPATLAHLGRVLVKELAALEVSQPLDVSLMRGSDRRIPRLVARWAHSQQDNAGTPEYSGIRYESKLGGYECWAIFDGTPIRVVESAIVSRDDQALVRVSQMFKLTVH